MAFDFVEEVVLLVLGRLPVVLLGVFSFVLICFRDQEVALLGLSLRSETQRVVGAIVDLHEA